MVNDLCSKCGKSTTEKVIAYSTKKYGKVLCMECQNAHQEKAVQKQVRADPIVRQCCIKAAAHIVSGSFSALAGSNMPEVKWDDIGTVVTNMADQFERWVMRS